MGKHNHQHRYMNHCIIPVVIVEYTHHNKAGFSMKYFITLIFITITSSYGFSLNQYLCKKNEKLLFSFKLKSNNKRLSICIPKNKQKYIVYRFGTPRKIELEYPNHKNALSWKKFTYSFYFRGGGAGNAGLDLNYLSFKNGNYQYKIYQEYSATSKKTIVGVKIKILSNNKTITIRGDASSKKGSLIHLRWNGRIRRDG